MLDDPATLYARAAAALFGGCAALIYEIVWFQLLQLVIGSSAVSLAVLLGTFMGGMCLGSFLPRHISARAPLRGVLRDRHRRARPAHLGVPLFANVYTAWGGSGPVGLVFRAIAASICLLPPTILMGATLPAMSRWVETSPQGVAWLGYFYGGNTGGAVIGSLLAGFYLLRVFDMATATYVAVALNLLVEDWHSIAGATRMRPAPACATRRRRQDRGRSTSRLRSPG